jgi:gluconolactonase
LKNRDNCVQPSSHLGRRSFLAGAVAAGVAATALSQTRSFEQDGPTVRYPDKDIITLDPKFAKYRVNNTPIQRLFTGCLWAEGTAWNAVGQYLLWSDIPNNIQRRWIADDGHVSVFRNPSNNSNGNTFDWQGRQISCEHGTRRVVRYEMDGSVTILADKWQGKPFNAPNDVVVHPNGDIWFTDPGYGSVGNYEGHKGELLIKEAVYRIDAKSGKLDIVTTEAVKPNGICFSHDYKKLYVADTGPSKSILVWDLVDETKLQNSRLFTNNKLTVKGVELSGSADGMRADKDGNIWAACGWVGEGFDGVHVFTPEGQRIGMILLPEIAANLCFGGEKRNRLFIAASQSLYSIYVEAQGAHIT